MAGEHAEIALGAGDDDHEDLVGSDEAFLLLFTGHVDLVRTFAGLLLPAIMGNLVGGAGVFALLAHAQVRGEMRQKD